MADSTISNLTAAAALDGTEKIAIVQSSATVRTTAQDIADLAGGSNIGNADLTIDTSGTRKLIMGGALSTDKFVIRNSADTADLLSVDGIGNVWSNGKSQVATNTVFGQYALDGSNVGTNNVAFGQYALSSSNSCDFMTVIGTRAGLLVTSAQKGTIVGYGAGDSLTTGFGASLFGNSAGASLTTQSSGSMFGNEAGTSTTGQYNTLFGARAGYSLTTGEYNLMLGGHNAGNGITTGDYNTIIGQQITGLSSSLTNNIILTDGQGNQALRKDANDNVILGQETALATTATDGFVHIPTCAGTPTGTPTTITGSLPMVIDSTNNKMYIYSGGAWVALN